MSVKVTRMRYQINVYSLYEKLSCFCIKNITIDVKLLLQHCALLSIHVLAQIVLHARRTTSRWQPATILKSLQAAHFISSSRVSNLTYQKLLSWFITIIRSCFRTRCTYNAPSLRANEKHEAVQRSQRRSVCLFYQQPSNIPLSREQPTVEGI